MSSEITHLAADGILGAMCGADNRRIRAAVDDRMAKGQDLAGAWRDLPVQETKVGYVLLGIRYMRMSYAEDHGYDGHRVCERCKAVRRKRF